MKHTAGFWVILALVLVTLAACSTRPGAEPSKNAPPPAPVVAAAPPAGAESPGVLPPVVYVSDSGAHLTAVFDNTTGTVRVTLPDGRQVTLPRAVSGSGARYSDGQETFWEHHGEGTYTVEEKVVFQGKAVDPE
jgi:hypothetical protein